MADVAIPTQQKGTGIEVTGIERVHENERAHTQLLDTMWLWWSANAVVATVALGSISVFFGLGVWGSIAVILIFNVLGVLPVAFLSTLGPKTGLAQMPLSRFSFGFQGAKLPAIFNALACIGWSAVNAVIGSSLLVSWSAGKIPQWLALIVLAVITTAISVYGYFIVHRYERYAWIPMAILFGYVTIAAAPHFHLNVAATATTALAVFVGVATFGGAIFGYAIGWSSYAADYTRRQPANTPANKVFWYAFIGVTLPCVLLETLGVLLTTTVQGGAAFDLAGEAGPLISQAIGHSPLAGVVLLLLAFSTIANNVPNDYSFALSTQVIGINVKRVILTIVGAVIYLAVAFYLQTNFGLNLENFLLLIAYWLGAWGTVVIMEHLFRRGIYPVDDYTTPAKLPTGIAAVASMVLGLAVAALGVSQQVFVGPLAHALGSKDIGYADIGFPLAIVATGILYFFLRRWELARYKR